MGDTNEETPGDLRTQRDQLASTNKELAAKVAAFEQREQLRDAGFGHLSARQQRSILRELAEDGKDFSAETAKEIAEDLGYPISPTTPTPTPNSDGNGDGTTTTTTTTTTEPDDAEDALTAMALMDRARAMAAGNAGNSDFETEMRKTDTKEELTNLIRTKGARHQIVHEWDVP